MSLEELAGGNGANKGITMWQMVMDWVSLGSDICTKQISEELLCEKKNTCVYILYTCKYSHIYHEICMCVIYKI